MKRLLSFLLVCTLLLGVGPTTVFAADITDIKAGSAPFADYNAGNMAPGASIQIPLNLAAFQPDDTAAADLTAETAAKLTLTVVGEGKKAEFDALFSSARIVLNTPELGNPSLTLNITAKSDLSADTPFEFQLAVGMAGSSNATATAKFSGTVKAAASETKQPEAQNPGNTPGRGTRPGKRDQQAETPQNNDTNQNTQSNDTNQNTANTETKENEQKNQETQQPEILPGTILGFNRITDVSTRQSMGLGETLTIPLGDGAFTYQGGSGSISGAKLREAGITAETGTTGFSAALSGTDVVITALNSAPAGNSNVKVTLRMGDLSESFSVPVRIVVPQVLTAPIIKQITGVEDGSSLGSPSYSETGGNLPLDGTVTIPVPDASFVYSAGMASDLDGNLSNLNGNKNWIQLSNGADSYFNKAFIASGSNVAIQLTPKTTGTPGAFTVTLSDGVGSTNPASVNALTIYDNTADRTPTGVVDNALAPQRTDSKGNNLMLNDEITIRFPADRFTWSVGTGSQVADVNTMKDWVRGIDTTYFDASYSVSGADLILTLKAKKTRTTSLSMDLYLRDTTSETRKLTVKINSIGTVSVTGNKITGIDSSAWLGSNASHNGKYVSSLDSLDVRPDDYLILELNSDFFTWEKGKPSPAANVTSSQLKSGKIDVKYSSKKGGNLIDQVKIESNGGRAYIVVWFVEEFASTKEKDFEFTVYLTHDKKRDRDTEVTITGTMENEVFDLYDDEEYVDLSEGGVAKAHSYLRDVEVYLGSGVTIWARMFSGRSYYGHVSMEPTNADIRVMDKFPSIEAVYNLSTVNLDSSGNKVSFDDLDDRLYVYDGDGNYLGTTNQKVAYSNKYYISSKRIDMKPDEDVSEPDFPNDPPILGGTPGNNTGNSSGGSVIEPEPWEPNPSGNYNPPTGR